MKSKLATMGTPEEIQAWQQMRDNPVSFSDRVKRHMLYGGTEREMGAVPSPFISVTENLKGLRATIDEAVQTIIFGKTLRTGEPAPGYKKANNLIEMKIPENKLINLRNHLKKSEIRDLEKRGNFVGEEGERLIETPDLLKEAIDVKVQPNPY